MAAEFHNSTITMAGTTTTVQIQISIGTTTAIQATRPIGMA